MTRILKNISEICRKPVRDTPYARVIARRYRCLKCNRTFRAYPTGISRPQQLDTMKGLKVLLFILGLSYQGVSDARDTWVSFSVRPPSTKTFKRLDVKPFGYAKSG